MSLARSPLLDDTGQRVTSCAWEPPRGSSPYFGWMGDAGFSTLKMESIVAMFPNPQRSDLYIILLSTGAQMAIGLTDGERLIKRLGWTEPGNSHRA